MAEKILTIAAKKDLAYTIYPFITNTKTLKKNTVPYGLIVVSDIFIVEVLKVLYFCQHTI